MSPASPSLALRFGLSFEDLHHRSGLQRLDEAFPVGARVPVAYDSGDPATAYDALTPTERAVHDASIAGDRRTLRADAYVPAIMAGIYLLLLIYFKMIGGYKPVHLAGTTAAKA